MKRTLVALLMGLVVSLSVQAGVVGKVETSGLLLKDSITIHSFRDPSIDGVVCHVTTPKRSLSFEDQTDTSIACRQYKKQVTGNYKRNAKNIFSRSKNLFFKKFRVDRFYDKQHNTIVYIAYTKKLSGDNASHSISTVPLLGE